MNSPIQEFNEKARLKMFFKVIIKKKYTIQRGFKRLSGLYEELQMVNL